MHSLGPIEVVDYHVAGAPFRVVVSGAPRVAGANALDHLGRMRESGDDVRRLLVNEPRGHSGLHGGFVTTGDAVATDLGVVFFHQGGYSTVSGRGVIALVTWAIESGAVPVDRSHPRLTIDTPSGGVAATAVVDGDRVESVTFANVTSYVTGRFIPVQLADEVVSIDIAYGGAYYATVDAAELEEAVTMDNVDRFVTLGREIGQVLADNPAIIHPTDHRLSGLAGTVFYETLDTVGSARHERSVTVTVDGRVDRSPCGGGTSARLALLDSSAELPRGGSLVNESLIGGRFVGRVVADGEVGGLYGVVPEVQGRAFRTSGATFWLDADDPIGLGYQLR